MDQSDAVLLLLAGLLLVLSFAFVLPFLQYFLLAVLLAYVLAPAHERLEDRIGPRASAGILVLTTTVGIVLPVVLVLRAIAGDVIDILQQLQAEEVVDVREAVSRIAELEVSPMEVLRSAFGDVNADTVDSVLEIFGTVSHAMIGLGLTLFLLFYFLKDGPAFVRWLGRTLPVNERVQAELAAEINDITRAVLMGHVLVAIIQGAIAGIGLFITGIPNALFWTVVMIGLALLPIVGSFLVWGPAVIYLLLIDRPVASLFLLVYGTIVVGITDDYLRPIVVERYAHVNPSVIIIGVLGGLYVIGVMGLFFGPIIIAALPVTLEVLRNEYERTPRE